MDDKTLRVEVRLETKDVPRDRVSRIIWLHADETRPVQEARRARPSRPGRPACRPSASDGIRLTFAAERFADGDPLRQERRAGRLPGPPRRRSTSS